MELYLKQAFWHRVVCLTSGKESLGNSQVWQQNPLVQWGRAFLPVFSMGWLQHQRLHSKPIKTWSRTCEHQSNLPFCLLFPYYWLQQTLVDCQFYWRKLQLHKLLGKTSQQILKNEKCAKMESCSKSMFCDVGQDNTGNECGITQACPSGSYITIISSFVPATKKCVLETAIQGRHQSFSMESGLFTDFVLGIFLGQVPHLKQEKLKNAAFPIWWAMPHVFIMDPSNFCDRRHWRKSNQNTQLCPLTSLTLVLRYISICCKLKMMYARTLNAEQDN